MIAEAAELRDNPALDNSDNVRIRRKTWRNLSIKNFIPNLGKNMSYYMNLKYKNTGYMPS